MDTDGLAAAVTKQGSLVRQMKKVRGCWHHGQAFFRVLDYTYTGRMLCDKRMNEYELQLHLRMYSGVVRGTLRGVIGVHPWGLKLDRRPVCAVCCNRHTTYS